jgi:predicted nucleic acid-binding protein
LRRIQSRRLKASTDVEVIQEILHIFRRRDEPDRGVILSSLIYSLGMKVLPVRSVDIKTAIFYYDKYKSLAIPSRDFVHLGIALNRSIKRIITTDRHFDSIDEVERIDPLDLF